jgi:transducin (beta)-like 1
MPPGTLLAARAVKLRGHIDEVAFVAWQPGEMLAPGSGDGPGEEVLATGSEDGTVRLWDLKRPGTPVVVLEMGARVNCLAWSGDGRRLAVGGWSGEVAVWSRGGRRVAGLEGHTSIIVVIQFNGSSHLVVTTSEDRTYRVWEVETGICRQVVTTVEPDLMGAVALTWRDENEFFLGKGATVLLCRVGEDNPVRVLTGHMDWVSSLAWDPRFGILASGSSDGTVRTWRPDAVLPARAVLASHGGGVWEVVWRPGKPGILASFSGDVHEVMIWDVIEGTCLHTLPCALGGGFIHHGNTITYSPDGRLLAAGGEEARVWTADTGELALVSQVAADAVGWSPGGNSLAVASPDGPVVRVFSLDLRLKALAAQAVSTSIREQLEGELVKGRVEKELHKERIAKDLIDYIVLRI